MSSPDHEDQRSIVFDRATDDYDRTRGLPPEAMDSLVRLLAAELEGHQPCLEIGVGTGRIGIPLAEQGIQMVGIDLSTVMLAELRRKAGGRWPFPVAVADAVHLPFASGSVKAGLAVHVLHLIPAWRDALRELARVIGRPGVALVDIGGWGRGWWKELQQRFCEEAGIAVHHVGVNEAGEVDDCMASVGGALRGVERVEVVETTTVEERIARLEAGLYSFTWRADEETRRAAAARVRRWAVDRYGPLDEEWNLEGAVAIRVYDLE
jgi:ubiquinone/menaquinone biosynthesis C-methylase UbiE